MKGSLKWMALALALTPAVVFASWWSNDWKFRKEISLDLSPTGADVAGSAQDLPLLLRLSLANFSYFADTKPDGADFRFVGGDDKTPLKYHIEKYDPQNQMALLWVRAPQLSGGAKTDKLYAYYGNPDAPAAADVAGTYDNNQALVLSFSDAAGTPQDGTAYKNNPSSSTAELTPASLIGGGAKFAGAQTITIPASPSLRLVPTQGLTASAWMKFEQPEQAVILALADGNKKVTLGLEGSKFVARAAFSGAPATVTAPADSPVGQWHHAALSVGGGKLTLYVDGAPAGSAAVTAEEIGGTLTVGSEAGRQPYTGELDEVEVAKTARSADWIKLAAKSQGIDSNLVTYGADGQKEGGAQTSYFVTIAKNLTVDGWVVIGICMGMLVIALGIILFKAFFLSRVERANTRFLTEFRRLSGDTAALDKPSGHEPEEFEVEPPTMKELKGDDGQFGASTLYRLYHSGVRELNKRVGGATVSAAHVRSLSPQSIDAIRASMDASMTRLQQSLASQMVLLTIAISGGPFLGLLGTVIGVMITFAAIALSGDVNVNAIAPGVAAALAATVAGLAVAIPALFGYNWLNTRIKNIAADNRVFVDEFVTRVAEQYS